MNKGDKVFYDKVVASDGYQWLTYLSYSGVRRYAPIEKLAVAQPLPRPEKSRTVSNSTLSKSGTYRFSKEVAVKNSPKASAKTEFTFAKGETIYYDRTLEADHYQWLSYISYSGIRRYVALGQLADFPAAVGQLSLDQVVRILSDLEDVTDLVGLTIAEHLPWDAIQLRNSLSQLAIFKP